MKGLCQLSEVQNPDSFEELNVTLKNTTPFLHTHTHTCVARPVPGESKILAVTISLFLSPHTGRWTVSALMIG